MKISKEIAAALSPELLKTFEESVEKMVNDLVTEGVAKGIAVKEKELKQKYDLVAEEYVQKKLVMETAKMKASLIEENDKKLETLEKKVVSRLGSFVDRMVSENISDALVEKVAMNEVAFPIVSGLKALLESNMITVEPKIVDETANLSEQITVLKKQLSESISQKMGLDARLSKSVGLLVLSEKTQGLTPSQKKRVITEFKDSSYEDMTSKIDGFVTLVKEATDEVSKKIGETKRKTLSEGKSFDKSKRSFGKIISESDFIPKKAKVEEVDPLMSTVESFFE